MHPTIGLTEMATVNPYLQIAPSKNAFSLAFKNNSHSPSLKCLSAAIQSFSALCYVLTHLQRELSVSQHFTCKLFC